MKIWRIYRPKHEIRDNGEIREKEEQWNSRQWVRLPSGEDKREQQQSREEEGLEMLRVRGTFISFLHHFFIIRGGY